jgi:hypothetical protein
MEVRQSRKDCESLTEFVRQGGHVVEPGQTYVHNWHINALCDHLEEIFRSEGGEGELIRFLGNVPPGTMKSLLAYVISETLPKP